MATLSRLIFDYRVFAVTGVFIWICVIFWVLAIQRPSVNTDQSVHCELKSNECEFSLTGQKYRVNFSPTPQIEEQLTITFVTEYDMQVKDAFIEGVNMYMGRIPVVEESKTNAKWQGWTMLGACSEPNMVWHLVVSFNHTQVRKVIRFTTHVDAP